MKVYDEIQSCNKCRTISNQINSKTVIDNKPILGTICTRCGHQDKYSDGLFTTEGNCIKIIEMEKENNAT